MDIKEALRDTGLVTTGIFSAAFGLKGFLLSSHFIDGGVTGISMLLANIFEVPISILIFLINIPFLLLGLRQMGLRFALKSALAIAGLSLCLAFVPFPDVTPDKLLTAIFGGFFIGVGIGLAMRGGAVLDGTEIAAVLLSRKAHILKVSDIILIFNVVIFLSALYFLGVTPALYSILTYLGATKMLDFILNGIEQYTAITIISDKSEPIRKMITENLQRGVTIYQGKSGLCENLSKDIIMTVATRLEIPEVKREILHIDPAAFIMQQSVEDTTGGLLKRKGLH